MKIIARIKSDFPTKFGIPHQSGRIESLQAKIIFEPEFRNPDMLRGLEEYSYLWLIWEFSENKTWSPTVRPPRLGGNVRKGVFATRSPFRPNPIGLSSAKLEKIQNHPELGPVIWISGADLMDGTPIYDIKPYLPGFDVHPDARGGFTETIVDHSLKVCFPEALLGQIPREKRENLIRVLADDPRPGYQKDPERIYGMPFAGKDIHFKVEGDTLTVVKVTDFYKKK